MVLNLKKTNLWPKNDIFVKNTIILKFLTEILKTKFSTENWKRVKLQSV